MTAAGFAGPDLLAWHRRFPARRHLWAGRLRLWRVELPVRPPSSLLADWASKASAGGAPPSAAARRLGLPPVVIAAIHMGGARPDRRTFAFLDFPAGPLPVAAPGTAFPPWPEPAESIPASVLRPTGVDVVAPSSDWRTVPVVGAEAVDVVAVGTTNQIAVYAADRPNETALWELPSGALPLARPDDWAAAWRAWISERGHSAAGTVVMRDGVAVVTDFAGPVPEGQWLQAGDGPLREAAPVEVRGAN